MITGESAYKNSKSGFRGIYFEPKRKNKWRAIYRVNGKQFNIGYFYDIDSAIKAREVFRCKIIKRQEEL